MLLLERTPRKKYMMHIERKTCKKNSRCSLEGHIVKINFEISINMITFFVWNRSEIDSSDVKTVENIENYY
jgi:hypothetical protein